MKNKNTENTKNDKSENTCQNIALFRYTWAGRDESFICLEHAGQLKTVANAIGYYLQLIPIEANPEIICRQITE
jgi:hypothetical protein